MLCASCKVPFQVAVVAPEATWSWELGLCSRGSKSQDTLVSWQHSASPRGQEGPTRCQALKVRANKGWMIYRSAVSSWLVGC